MLLYLSMLDTQEEKDKFTEIYQQYQHFCWYVANQLLGDAHLAEDAVQDAFLALTRHLDKIEDVESPKNQEVPADHCEEQGGGHSAQAAWRNFCGRAGS